MRPLRDRNIEQIDRHPRGYDDQSASGRSEATTREEQHHAGGGAAEKKRDTYWCEDAQLLTSTSLHVPTANDGLRLGA